MRKINLNRNNMLFLFTSVGVDMTWRCNHELQIIVPFKEYAEFIRLMRNYELLYFPMAKYISALNNETILLKYFYFDLSRVIASEVSIARIEGATPTAILPDTDGVDLLLSQCGAELSTFNKDSLINSMKAIRDEFFSDGIALPTEEGRSRDLCRLAYLLRVSTTTNTVAKYNIKEEYNG